MSKKRKKRKEKITVYACAEGDREVLFLQFLEELYDLDKQNINLKIKPLSGGDANYIVDFTLRNGNNYDRSFAWFDEDFDPENSIQKDTRIALASHWRIDADSQFLQESLKNLQNFNTHDRKPILIVSQPVCVEALIIQIS